MEAKTYTRYLNALLSGDRRACTQLVNELLAGGLPLRELYIDLFRPAMYEVGTRWERNEISVASEHLATAITESLMTLSYPQLFDSPRVGKRSVVACTAGEQHQIGGRMVADFFELHGWDSDFVGSNVPAEELVRFLADRTPDVLALSLSIRANLPQLELALDRICSRFAALPVLVGGQGLRGGELRPRPQVAQLETIEELEVFIEEQR